MHTPTKITRPMKLAARSKAGLVINLGMANLHVWLFLLFSSPAQSIFRRFLKEVISRQAQVASRMAP
jgi:hypothetical protein